MRMHIALGMVLCAAPLAAQQPGHQHDTTGEHPAEHRMMMQQMMQEMMAPMMRVMAFTPQHLLARGDSLQLTAPQVQRLTALRDAAREAHDAARSAAQSHRDAMIAAMSADAPDTSALHGHFQAMHVAMGNAHWAMLRAAAQARAVLTASQRRQVAAWAETMQMRSHERP